MPKNHWSERRQAASVVNLDTPVPPASFSSVARCQTTLPH